MAETIATQPRVSTGLLRTIALLVLVAIAAAMVVFEVMTAGDEAAPAAGQAAAAVVDPRVDYGIRHLGEAQATSTDFRFHDYGLRHLAGTAAPAVTPLHDYGIRHLVGVDAGDLDRSEDYGLRHLNP